MREGRSASDRPSFMKFLADLDPDPRRWRLRTQAALSGLVALPEAVRTAVPVQDTAAEVNGRRLGADAAIPVRNLLRGYAGTASAAGTRFT